MAKRNIKKLSETAKIPSHYILSLDELDELLQISNVGSIQGRYTAIMTAFNAGFVSGERAEKRKARKLA